MNSINLLIYSMVFLSSFFFLLIPIIKNRPPRAMNTIPSDGTSSIVFVNVTPNEINIII